MLQSLRPNSQIFILQKNENPTFEIGYVTNVSVPRNKYGITTSFAQPQELVVDVVVKINDSIVNYNGLPTNLDIADSYIGGDQIIISDNKGAMNSEVLNLKNKSQDIINSVETHKKLLQEYDKILGTLNPEIAEKQNQKDEINSIKSQMSEMSKSMNELIQANRLLMEQLKRKE